MKLKVKKLRKLPFRELDGVKEYNELYIIPSGKKHSSGWALMYVIGKNNNEIEIAAACNDICWDMTQAKDYSLRNNMIYPSGILHCWSNSFKFEVGVSSSTANIRLISKF